MNLPNKNLARLLLYTSMILAVSCKKSTRSLPVPKPEPALSMPIEKIQASIAVNIDIASRKNLALFLRGHKYSYVLNSPSLTAVPVNDPYALPYIINSDGSLPGISEEKSLLIQLMAEGYLTQNSLLKDGPPPSPVLKNQDTEEDLINTDILVGKFWGIPSKNLSGVNLTHGNNLLDLELTDIPDTKNLTVTILSRADQFRPFKVSGTKYSAVITGDWFSPADLSVSIKTGNKDYTVKMLDGRDIKQDRHYRFTLKFNAGNSSFSIQKHTEIKWSEEKWPG